MKMKKGRKHTTMILARISKGMEQQELAERVCKDLGDSDAVTPNIISKLENGWRRSVSQPVARSIARILGITLNEIKAGGINVKE